MNCQLQNWRPALRRNNVPVDRLPANRICQLALGLLLAALSAPSITAPTIVNDITQLNPISVDSVVRPTRISEVVAAVSSHDGPISIGGGRYSMGGQTAEPNSMQIDMRGLNHVVGFDRVNKRITVESGMTWRALQEYIDPFDLSVRIMQTYSNFTVGGSASVNVHGRYVGEGPIIRSIESIRLVLADGTLVTASRSENAALFYAAIGGYGAVGVIVEVTLTLTDNVRVERTSRVMPLSAYRAYFESHIRNHPEVIFHNADIYPNAFDTVRAISYARTEKPATVRDRLVPLGASHAYERSMFVVVSEWPGGQWYRRHILEPWLFRKDCVEWRNYEASRDVSELEPSSRERSTYVLQEYFVPIDRLGDFVPRMGAILNRHHVNAINVSIRHSLPDPGSYMAWARTEVFALVLYYKQGTSEADRAEVGRWTRELIDAAVAMSGTYYLPYQIWATKDEFAAAYPHASELFEVKRRVDPTNKFRNRLLDAYFSSPRS